MKSLMTRNVPFKNARVYEPPLKRGKSSLVRKDWLKPGVSLCAASYDLSLLATSPRMLGETCTRKERTLLCRFSGAFTMTSWRCVTIACKVSDL